MRRGLRRRDSRGATVRVKEPPPEVLLRALASLPVSLSSWSVGVRPAPREKDPAGIYSFGMVVEDDTGLVRAARIFIGVKDADLVELILDAALARRFRLTPARPPSIHLESADHRAFLEQPLANVGVPIAGATVSPAFEYAFASLVDHLDPLTSRPLLGTALCEMDLAKAAAAIASAAPWNHLDREIPLEIRHGAGGQPGRLLLIFGVLGETFGVSAYPDEAALRIGARGVATLTAWTLLFHRAAEIAPEMRDGFSARGLPVSGGLYPHFLRLVGAPPRPQEPDEAAVAMALADLRVLNAYIEQGQLRALAAGSARPVELDLSDGARATITPRFDLMSSPAPSSQHELAPMGLDGAPMTPFDAVPHRMYLGEVPRELLADHVDEPISERLARCVIFRMRKPDAVALRPFASGIDGIAIQPAEECDYLHAFAGSEPLGPIATLDHDLDTSWMRSEARCFLILAAGGAERPMRTLRSDQLIAVQPVEIIPVEYEDEDIFASPPLRTADKKQAALKKKQRKQRRKSRRRNR